MRPTCSIISMVFVKEIWICAVIGCSANSYGEKWLTFHKLFILTKRLGEKDFELRKKCLDGYLVTISREGIDPKSTEQHDYRVCSRHFVSGKPANFYETNKPAKLVTYTTFRAYKAELPSSG